MFRDFIFTADTSSSVQGTNYLELQFSGLSPEVNYEIAVYSFDALSLHTTTWTATAPTSSLGVLGWWDGTGTNNVFTAPADEQTMNWRDGTAASTIRAPALFTLKADSSGTATVWGWGGDGGSDQTPDVAFLNGFQIALAVPEPTSLALLVGAGGMACGLRRDRRAP
jgi:hypothetical protein